MGMYSIHAHTYGGVSGGGGTGGGASHGGVTGGGASHGGATGTSWTSCRIA